MNNKNWRFPNTSLTSVNLETTTPTTPIINVACATDSTLFTGSRIIGGVPAISGELPWQVLFDNESCGGTLVSLKVSIVNTSLIND